MCPTCNKNKSITDPVYGITECQQCRNKGTRPKRPVEFTSDSIREGRREYYNDVIQPYRGDTLSKEYLEVYGTKGIDPTPEEVKNAKFCWKDTKGWEDRGKAKKIK